MWKIGVDISSPVASLVRGGPRRGEWVYGGGYPKYIDDHGHCYCHRTDLLP